VKGGDKRGNRNWKGNREEEGRENGTGGRAEGGTGIGGRRGE
jgi:hypothetical protein